MFYIETLKNILLPNTLGSRTNVAVHCRGVCHHSKNNHERWNLSLFFAMP